MEMTPKDSEEEYMYYPKTPKSCLFQVFYNIKDHLLLIH